MPRDYFDPLQSIIEAAKAKRVDAVQDPSKMKRDHISRVGRMVFHTTAREAEPFLTTNQMFAREVDTPVGHGEYVPPKPYKSWANFDIITGGPRPPMHKMAPELAAKLASVDPRSRANAWDHLDLPRSQQSNQLFLRSHDAFPRHPAHPHGAVEWRSAAKLVESKAKHERPQFSHAEKYARPVTAASEMGWGLEADYQHGRVPPKDFYFGCARAAGRGGKGEGTKGQRCAAVRGGAWRAAALLQGAHRARVRRPDPLAPGV